MAFKANRPIVAKSLANDRNYASISPSKKNRIVEGIKLKKLYDDDSMHSSIYQKQSLESSAKNIVDSSYLNSNNSMTTFNSKNSSSNDLNIVELRSMIKDKSDLI
eukprot:GHVR01089679.1.p1 GENE.GHVR01089679.1~~GHVR01089679.1.p1  ORF type:complete len:105 (-),score=2.55 GHVR01089679.1:473-787(-)